MELATSHNMTIFHAIKNSQYAKAEQLIEKYSIDPNYEDGDINELVSFKETKQKGFQDVYSNGYGFMYLFMEKAKNEAPKMMCPVCSVAAGNLFLTLLQNGVSPYKDKKFSKSPIYSIFKSSCTLCMALLYTEKYNFEAPIDDKGNRPLHIVTDQYDVYSTSFLLRNVEVNPNVTNNAGRCALYFVLCSALLLNDKTKVLEILKVFSSISGVFCPIPSFDDYNANFNDKLVYSLLFGTNIPAELTKEGRSNFKEIRKIAQNIAHVAIKKESKNECVIA